MDIEKNPPTDSTKETSPPTLIQIENLCIGPFKHHHIHTESNHMILNHINLTIGQEIVCLIGESGSGKSTLAKAIIGILNPALCIYSGRIDFHRPSEEAPLNLLNPKILSQARGKAISMIMQEPKYALNPMLTLKKQLDYAYQGSLQGINKTAYFHQLLDDVGLTPDVLNLKPNKLSGGMGQRFMVALSLINTPKFIIADEPTSALDYDMKHQILALITERCRAMGIGLLLISHDLPSVKQFADKIYIMKSGQIVDSGNADLLEKSEHPYTRLLWACKPSSNTYQKMLATSQDTH